MGTNSYSQHPIDPNNQKDASSDYAQAQGYQSNVGYNGREMRRFASKLRSTRPKPQINKSQGFK